MDDIARVGLSFTLERAAAISKVPTVSMFEAMMGIPRMVCFELRNLISRYKSTCNRLIISLLNILLIVHYRSTTKHLLLSNISWQSRSYSLSILTLLHYMHVHVLP